MEQFAFFNQRLTDKLNQIYLHPLTIVSGAPGAGKTFSISNFLFTSRAEAIWHTSRAETFGSYLTEFSRIFTARDARFSGVEELAQLSDPAGAAVDVAVRIRGVEGHPGRRVYVLEYVENEVPDPVLIFLYYLSCQQVRNLALVLIHRAALQDRLSRYGWSGINLISEDCFRIRPCEMSSAFSRNGLPIGDAEANELYLRSAGWLPEISRLFYLLREKGREELYGAADREAFFWDGSPEWKGRFRTENDLWHLPALAEVRRCVEAVDQDQGFIAIERARLRAVSASPEWDLCEYYGAVLQMLDGKMQSALKELNREFEHRVQQGLYASANRLHLARMQLMILAGGEWFENERELLISTARRSIYEKQGISGVAAALALWRAKESRKLIALLGEAEEEDPIDAVYRDFLLAAACSDLGMDGEAVRHYDAAWSLCVRGRIWFPAVLFSGLAAEMDAKRGTKSGRDAPDASPEFRDRLKKWRGAMYKNAVSDPTKGREALTVRESEVAECVARRMSNREIAERLSISENTVKTTLKHIYAKLRVSSRRELQ